MARLYTALITGTPDWDLTVGSLNIDFKPTEGQIVFVSPETTDYDEALTRLAGKLQVFESIDGEAPVKIVDLDMEAADRQERERRVTSDVVTLRAQGAVTHSTVTDRDVSDRLLFSQRRGSSRTWRILYERAITPGSTVLRGTEQRLTVDRSAININPLAESLQNVTEDGTP